MEQFDSSNQYVKYLLHTDLKLCKSLLIELFKIFRMMNLGRERQRTKGGCKWNFTQKLKKGELI